MTASAFKKFQVISHVISHLISHVILRVISWFTQCTRFELSKATSVAVAAIASRASRVSWQKGSFFYVLLFKFWLHMLQPYRPYPIFHAGLCLGG